MRIGEPLRPEFAAAYRDSSPTARSATGYRGRGPVRWARSSRAAQSSALASAASWMIGNAGKGIVRGSPETVVAKIKAPNGG